MNKDLYINGQWCQGAGNELISQCPATNETIATVNEASDEQVVAAVDAATTAFDRWSALSLDERQKYVETYQKLLERDKDKLALLIAKEVGKPIWEAKTEVMAMINKIAISLEALHQRTPLVQGLHFESNALLTHRPHGVMVVLGPYNFPGHLPNGHIVPALLAGNTLVFKPSELTPMVANAMMMLFDEANFPPGVINLIQGAGSVGAALLEQKIEGVLFTGSYATGKKIHQHFAGRPEIILALEMGGNNPLIVSEMNNIDAAVYTTIQSAFITSGQRCTCARRLIVPNSNWGNLFIERLIKRCQSLSIGGYYQEPEPFMGPVISLKAAQNLLAMQAKWLEQGAVALLQMEQREGAILTPGIIDVSNMGTDEDLEIFGPLLQVRHYNNFDEAIAIANETKYGLAAGLLSEDLQQQKQFYQQAKAGIVNINQPMMGASSKAPFGGIGLSGNHRPSAFYAADFCAYPVASMVADKLVEPETKLTGMNW
jgi:succinylglutamic semialdehyde dehydrogenase